MITYTAITVNAITVSVDVLHQRFLASWVICNPSPWSDLSKNMDLWTYSTISLHTVIISSGGRKAPPAGPLEGEQGPSFCYSGLIPRSLV